MGVGSIPVWSLYLVVGFVYTVFIHLYLFISSFEHIGHHHIYSAHFLPLTSSITMP